jgi:hypothetical protein
MRSGSNVGSNVGRRGAAAHSMISENNSNVGQAAWEMASLCAGVVWIVSQAS